MDQNTENVMLMVEVAGMLGGLLQTLRQAGTLREPEPRLHIVGALSIARPKGETPCASSPGVLLSAKPGLTLFTEVHPNRPGSHARPVSREWTPGPLSPAPR